LTAIWTVTDGAE